MLITKETVMKKILLIGVASQNYLNFKQSFIKFLQKNECEIYVIAFDDLYATEIESWGCKFFCVKGNNRSLNLFAFMSLKRKYKRIIREVNPDIVMTFMLKPNVFGVKAANELGVPKIYALVEGAGDVFIQETLKWKVIRIIVCALYKRSFPRCEKIIFSNMDDKEEFVMRRLCREAQCVVVSEPGVDLQYFSYKPIKNSRVFLMIARMLKTKGVLEYCQAAKEVKRTYPDAIFYYIGPEGTLTTADIQEYISQEIVQYLGVQRDVRPYIEETTVNVLPSYREGLGMVNLESAAIGRMSITCNTNGTKDTVVDGYNGFLIPVGNSEKLAEKMIWCIEHPDEVIIMGKNARRFCEENFCVEKINRKLFDIIMQRNNWE